MSLQAYGACSFATLTRALVLATLSCLAACDSSDAETADAGSPGPVDAGPSKLVDAGPSKLTDGGRDASSEPTDAGRPSRDADLPPGADGGQASDAAIVSCGAVAACPSVRTAILNIDTCCTKDIECGYDNPGMNEVERVSFYEAIGADPNEPCFPASKLFKVGPTNESDRVVTPDGGQLLVSSDCPTVYMTSLPFRGCCLPSNECAVTTHPLQVELGVLAGGSYPFTQIECVPVEELNAQFKASPLAGFGALPSAPGTCDYAALDRTLPRESP
jgi:hypothetical protein